MWYEEVIIKLRNCCILLSTEKCEKIHRISMKYFSGLEGAMRRGRQNYESKVFGSINIPYPGQINFRWTLKIFMETKSQKAYKGAPKREATFFFFFWRQQNFCRGAKW